VKFSK